MSSVMTPAVLVADPASVSRRPRHGGAGSRPSLSGGFRKGFTPVSGTMLRRGAAPTDGVQSAFKPTKIPWRRRLRHPFWRGLNIVIRPVRDLQGVPKRLGTR